MPSPPPPRLPQPPPVPAMDLVAPPLLSLMAAKVDRQRLVSVRWHDGQAAGSSARLKLRRSSNLDLQAGQWYS